MRIEGVYQVDPNTPPRIAVSLTQTETEALLEVLTPDGRLVDGEQTHAVLAQLRKDLRRMARRRGWNDGLRPLAVDLPARTDPRSGG